MIKKHKVTELEFLGPREWDSCPNFLPGDLVGWFFGVSARGIVISTSLCCTQVMVLWSVSPSQPPFIDDNGMLVMHFQVQLEKTINYIQCDLKT